MEKTLDTEDIALLDAFVSDAKRENKPLDSYLQGYVLTPDKSNLKRSDIAGGRCFYEGYQTIQADRGRVVVYDINTGS